LSAVKTAYRAGLALRPGHRYTVSVDLDGHFSGIEANAARWDYGIGCVGETGKESVVWVEAHPASSTGEVQKMLDKLAWLRSKLDLPEFVPLKKLAHEGAPFRWLAMTGAVRILPNSHEARRLARAGLSSPQRRIDLP